MSLGPSDRIQVTREPAFPSKCPICGRTQNGNLVFLDFGLSIQRYGAVTFCGDCAINIGQAVDMVLLKDHLELQESFERISEIAFELKEQLDESTRGLDTIKSLFNLPDDFGSISTPDVETPVSESTEPDVISEDTERTPESDTGTGDSLEIESGTKSFTV